MTNALLWAASVLATSASAQVVTPGTWTGALRIADGAPLAVEYTVKATGDSVEITMKTADGPPSPVTDLRLVERQMAFRWGSFACTLGRKQERTYAGPCRTADGTVGQLTLTAPSTEVFETGGGGGKGDVLTTEDLVGTRTTNVYDAVAKLRPRWLRPRTPTASIVFPPEVHVYLGDQPMGGVDFLRTLEPDAVKEVRFYATADATTRWGSQNTGGVIAVTRRGQGNAAPGRPLEHE